MTHKKMNKSMQKKRKYENTCYVFCNYCCAELNSRNLQKHQLLHCNGWHDLICKRCGVVDPHHTNCKFAYVQCGYCETSFYKYEIRAHETECGNILLKCDDCHRPTFSISSSSTSAIAAARMTKATGAASSIISVPPYSWSHRHAKAQG